MRDVAAKCRNDVREIRSFDDTQAHAEILCEHLEHVLLHAAELAVNAEEARVGAVAYQHHQFIGYAEGKHGPFDQHARVAERQHEQQHRAHELVRG